jgi:hypothetical protein
MWRQPLCLPGNQSLTLVSESKDSESKAVAHVHNASNLQDREMWFKHSDIKQLPANLKQHATREPTRNGGDGPAGDKLKDATMEDMSEAVWIMYWDTLGQYQAGV